jgi:hypothetical protein
LPTRRCRIARIVGWLLVAAALVVAGADLLASLEQDAVVLRPLGELWFRLDPGSLNLAQAVVQRYLHPALWDPAIVAVLRLPAVVAFGLPGLALVLACRRPRRRRLFS